MRKRNFEDFDPNKSDSNDSDYDAAAARARPTKVTKQRRTKPSRKKRRTGYGGDGSDELSDNESEASDDDSFEEEEEPQEADIDPRTGRPVRKVAKKPVVYEESDGNSIDFMNDINSDDEEDMRSPKQQKKKPLPQKQLIVKLKTQRTVRRSTRAGSGSTMATRPGTADLPPGATRRSSRIAHDDTEGLLALTRSGNHVEVTRLGTRSPDTAAQRPMRGGKGLKKPPSAIHEDTESSVRSKIEPEDDTGSLMVDPEIAASREDLGEGDTVERLSVEEGMRDDDDILQESAVVPESNNEEDDDDDDDDEEPLSKSRSRKRHDPPEDVTVTQEDEPGTRSGDGSKRRNLLSAASSRQNRSPQRGKKRGVDESSDFEPGAEDGAEENVTSSSESNASPRKASQDNDDSSTNARRSGRLVKTRASSRRAAPSIEHDSEEAEELAEELQELRGCARPRRAARLENSLDDRPQTRKKKPVDYRILRPDLNLAAEDDAPMAMTPSRRGRGGAGAWQRSLFSTYGPFGGAGGPAPVLGGPGGIGAAGGVDSDSSEDENAHKPRPAGYGGTIGMTPTSAAPPGFGAFPAAQAQGADALQASLGKVKDKQALADADPLGVDQHVNFDGVGGLQGHIDQLKEMVALPLLYPEVFQRFHVTPPRGVLFHGPPGTGKTLMARALATSVSSHGRKVTFYMRKGADALSKWVGEAERQLRQLFEEARKNQPSIIFFDEIDGLAPVRSSKQEQIHASIVSTLLALMDGMDGRGQVIVIGATNRPDSVDPALRRPGRFDREFYFPLPNTEARRMILDIHTKNWDPPVPAGLKDELAEVTKGYGGADLRALCTEAALNAVQRRYPQIYRSNEKLLIKPETINIAAKDFMVSVKKMIPSSERSASSAAAPLPKSIEPLLRQQLREVEKILAEVIPLTKPSTALEEAQFEDATGDDGMRAQRMQQEFERCRVFRPRLLIRGPPGMGQQYLAAALLSHFEGLHVQSFDLPSLLGDSTRSPEAATIQFFTEIKRHKPSVIYIPNVDVWYNTVGETVLSTFQGLLRSLSPTDQVLVLGVTENGADYIDQRMINNLFGYSKRNQYIIERPSRSSRREFFTPITEYLDCSPADFPNPADRKKRVFEELPVAPAPAPEVREPSKEELKAQKKKDRQTLNILKLRIQPIMDQIRLKFKKFRTGVIDEAAIRYLYDEEDPTIVTSDLPAHELRAQAQFRPFEKDKDDHGEPGLRELITGKFYYNLEIVTIEKRLSNGYYKRPKDFLADIKKLTKDAKNKGDEERLLKANELQANVEVDIGNIELEAPALAVECEALFLREVKREKEMIEKAKRLAEAEGRSMVPIVSNLPPADNEPSTEQSSGAILLGQPHTNGIANQPLALAQELGHSTLTNGTSNLSNVQGHPMDSNGTSAPSRQEDVPMTNTDDGPGTNRETEDSSFGPSAQTRPLHFHTGAPASLQQRLSYPGSLSQRSAITPMAEGTVPNMYENSASTTSSDKRMTGSSGALASQSTFERPEPGNAPSNVEPSSKSNRTETGLDISMLLGQAPSNSQLPSTQASPPSQLSVPNSTQSQHLSQPGQLPTVPPFPRNNPSAIHSILNTAPAHPPLTVDPALSQKFLRDVVDSTSGCSIEQLEQVYSALMSEIWTTRGVWNRPTVVEGVSRTLNELLADMAACQSFGPSSANMDL